MTDKTLTASEASEAAALRTAPVIDPGQILVNSEGMCWRELQVRLPAGSTFADLQEPGIWRKTQSSSKSLRRFDRLTILAHDEAWQAAAVVTTAGPVSATITKPVRTDLLARAEELAGDDLHRIIWVGNGYRIQRKSDDLFVSATVANQRLAELELGRMYPVPA